MQQNATKCSAIAISGAARKADLPANVPSDKGLAKPPPQPPDVTVLHVPAPQPVALEPKQIEALELIFLGLPDVKVAEKVGVHRHTIIRWRKIPAFAAVLETHGQEMQQAAMSGLKALLPDVVRALQWQLNVQDNNLNYRAAALLLKILLRNTDKKDKAA